MELIVILVIWKESLNSDGQKFYQYINKMNNYLSPQIIEHKIKTWHIKTLEIQGHAGKMSHVSREILYHKQKISLQKTKWCTT
jgi:5'(3')-deoxyribonucleotidase